MDSVEKVPKDIHEAILDDVRKRWEEAASIQVQRKALVESRQKENRATQASPMQGVAQFKEEWPRFRC